MTLEAKLRQQLANDAVVGRHDLRVSDPDSGWTVTLTADRRDDLTSLLWEVHFYRSPAAAPTVRAWAERIVGKTTGLLEPLELLEVDDLRQDALLRSKAPTEMREQLSYYEMRLRGTESGTLRRYTTSKSGGARLQTAFALTNEALVKFVRDVTTP